MTIGALIDEEEQIKSNFVDDDEERGHGDMRPNYQS